MVLELLLKILYALNLGVKLSFLIPKVDSPIKHLQDWTVCDESQVFGVQFEDNFLLQPDLILKHSLLQIGDIQ